MRMEHANAEKGEGVHHIAVATPNFDDAVRICQGKTLPISGTHSGIAFADLPTHRDHRVLLEVFSGMPGNEQARDAS